MNVIKTSLKFKNDLEKANRPQCLVVHHAAASVCSVAEVHQWHIDRGWAGIGYHFFIRKDGSIYRGRPEDAVGSHSVPVNRSSIGVCLEGNYEVEQVPTSQLHALVQLAKHFNLPIRKHKDYNETDCPGKNFPWDEFLAMVESDVLLESHLAFDEVLFTEEEKDTLYSGTSFQEDVAITPYTTLIYEDEENINIDYRELIGKEKFLYIYDGDTIVVESSFFDDTREDAPGVWTRLTGIQAPEIDNPSQGTKGQIGGRESKQFLENLFKHFNYNILIEWNSDPAKAKDDYNRPVSIVYLLHDGRYINVNKTMLANLHANHFPFLDKRASDLDEEAKPIVTFNKHDVGSWKQYMVPAPPELSEDFLDAFEDLVKVRQNYDNRDKVLGKLPPYGMRIGDVQTSIPPISINVSRQSRVERLPMLRQKGTLKSKSGKYNTMIELELFFSGADEINGKRIDYEEILQVKDEYKDVPSIDQIIEKAINLADEEPAYQKVKLDYPYYINGLRPLIAQFKKCPFVPIQNETLNNEFGILAVGLVGMSITTLDGFPNTVRVNLRLVEFDITSYIPEAIDMADYVIWPLFRWHYQRSMRPDSRGDYLSPVEGQNMVSNFTFGYVPVDLDDNEDEYKHIVAGDRDIQKERNESYHSWASIQRIRAQTKDPYLDYEKEYWDLHVIRMAIAQYESYEPDVWAGFGRNSPARVSDSIFYFPALRLPEQFDDNSHHKIDLPMQEGFLLPLLSDKYKKWGSAYFHSNKETNRYTKEFRYINDNDLYFVSMDRLDEMKQANIEHEIYVQSLESMMWDTEAVLPVNEYPIPDLTLRAIYVSLENMITTIEAEGKPVPVNQFLGSQDTAVQLHFRATSEQALEKFDELFKYSMHISQGGDSATGDFVPGFIYFDSEMTRLAGAKYFLIEKVDYLTVSGQPGVFDISVSMVDFNRSQREALEWTYISGIPENNNIEELTLHDQAVDFGQLQIMQELNTISLYPDLDLPFVTELKMAMVKLQLGVDGVIPENTDSVYAEPDFYMLSGKSKASLMMELLQDNMQLRDLDREGLTEEELKEMDRQNELIKAMMLTPQNLTEAYIKDLPPEMETGFSATEGHSKGFYHDYLRYDKRGRLARAFPAIQFVIMDEGQVVGMRRLFDNLYGMKGVLEASVHKARDVAADTAILAFSDPFNRFGGMDRMMGPPLDYAQDLKSDRVWRSLEIRESLMKERSKRRFKLHLQPGARVHLRMGYGSNIEDFPILFNGTITELQVGEIIQIVAQSDAIELVNQYIEEETFVTGQRTDNGVQPQDWIIGVMAARHGRIREMIRRASWGRYQSGTGVKHFGRSNYATGFFIDSELKKQSSESLLEAKKERAATIEEVERTVNLLIIDTRSSIDLIDQLTDHLLNSGKIVVGDSGEAEQLFEYSFQLKAALKEMEKIQRGLHAYVDHSMLIETEEAITTVTNIIRGYLDKMEKHFKIGETAREVKTLLLNYDRISTNVSEFLSIANQDLESIPVQQSYTLFDNDSFTEEELSSIQFWIKNVRMLDKGQHGGWLAGEMGDNIWKGNGMMNFSESGGKWFKDLFENFTYSNDYKEPKVRIRSAGKNAWDVIQGLAYTSADYIAAAHPFGLRSTLFHGRPHWLFAYEYDPEYVRQGRAGVYQRIAQMDPSSLHRWYDGLHPLSIEGDRINLLEEADRKRHLRYKPYMQIHMYDSLSDIMVNNIRATSMNVWTETHVQYYKTKSNESVMKVWADKNLLPEEIRIQKVRSDLSTGFGGRWDRRFLQWVCGIIGIPLTEIDLSALISYAAFSPSVFAFACNAQADGLRNMYQGTVTILGDGSLKPWDMVNINDDHNDMRGPCQVRSVTHTMSFEEGFVTIFEPMPCVTVEDEALAHLPETSWAISSTLFSVMLGYTTFAATSYIISQLAIAAAKSFALTPAGILVSTKLYTIKASILERIANLSTWAIAKYPTVASKGKAVISAIGSVFKIKAVAIAGKAALVVLAALAIVWVGGVSYTGIRTWAERLVKSEQVAVMTLMTWKGEPFSAGIRGHAGLVYGDRPRIASGGLFDRTRIVNFISNFFDVQRPYYSDDPLVDSRMHEIDFTEDATTQTTVMQQFRNDLTPFVSAAAEQQVTSSILEKLDLSVSGSRPYIQAIRDSSIYNLYKNLLSKVGLDYNNNLYAIVDGYLPDSMVPENPGRTSKPRHAYEAHTYGRAIEFRLPLQTKIEINGQILTGTDLLEHLFVEARTMGVNSMGYNFQSETMHIDIMINSERARPYWIRNHQAASSYSTQDFITVEDLLRAIKQ